MKVKINGKWSKHRPVRANTVGYLAEAIRLNGRDLAELCDMSDEGIGKTIRQLSSRVNRFRTGRIVRDPEMQFLGTRTGRWASECPDKSQTPRPNKVEVRFVEQPKSPLVDMDFAEIEKRVMAQTGTDPDKMGGRFYTAEVQARQEGKRAKLALELWRQANANLVGFWLHHALKAAVDKAMKDIQTQVDEEGCGAAFAALKEWK